MFCKCLTLSQTSPGFHVSAVSFMCLQCLLCVSSASLLMPLGNKPFENTVGKGEIARDEQFLLFPQCFLPICWTFSHFHQTWNCRLQTLSVWKSIKFVVWKRVKVCLARVNITKVCWERQSVRLVYARVGSIDRLKVAKMVFVSERQGIMVRNWESSRAFTALSTVYRSWEQDPLLSQFLLEDWW